MVFKLQENLPFYLLCARSMAMVEDFKIQAHHPEIMFLPMIFERYNA